MGSPTQRKGGLTGLLDRFRSRLLLNGVRRNGIENLGRLSRQDFQKLVGEGFRRRGFEVQEQGGEAPDGGIDLLVTRGGERFLVQCKQWQAAQSVGVSVVRELYDIMAAEQMTGGYLVTSGTFSIDAKRFASGRNVELLDGQALSALLLGGDARP